MLPIVFWLPILILQNRISSTTSREVRPYAEGCTKINPVQEVDESAFAQTWYEVYQSTNVEHTCGVYKAKRIGDHQYLSQVKLLYKNGTIATMEAEWDVMKGTSPPGIYLDVHNRYYHFFYAFLLDYQKMLITYRCEDNGNGKEEAIHVWSPTLEYDKELVKKVYNDNNLGHLPTEEGFANCPEEILKF